MSLCFSYSAAKCFNVICKAYIEYLHCFPNQFESMDSDNNDIYARHSAKQKHRHGLIWYDFLADNHLHGSNDNDFYCKTLYSCILFEMGCWWPLMLLSQSLPTPASQKLLLFLALLLKVESTSFSFYLFIHSINWNCKLCPRSRPLLPPSSPSKSPQKQLHEGEGTDQVRRGGCKMSCCSSENVRIQHIHSKQKVLNPPPPRCFVGFSSNTKLLFLKQKNWERILYHFCVQWYKEWGMRTTGKYL